MHKIIIKDIVDNNMKIGDTIKRIRKQMEMTQIVFAQHIGCKQHTLSEYENGIIFPSYKIIASIIKLAKSKNIKIKLEDFFK